MLFNIFKTSLFFILITTNAYSQDKKASEEKKEADKNKRLYTEKEFKDAVNKEIETRLKSLGEENLIELSKELMKKYDDLEEEKKKIEAEKRQITINSDQLKKKIVEFQTQQKKIIGCLDAQQEQRNKRIKHMVDVISGMRPANAAQILSVQDSALAVQILGKLQAEKVSKIFNSMDKVISARLQKQYLNMKK